MAKGSKKVVLAALRANAAMATGTWGRAAHRQRRHAGRGGPLCGDMVNQVFLLVSINLSDNPTDEEHPYGHGKERFFWAFLAALFIFVAGAFFSIYHGIEKLMVGGEHHGDYWPSYLVLGIAFVFDLIVLTLALRTTKEEAQAAGMGTRDYATI